MHIVRTALIAGVAAIALAGTAIAAHDDSRIMLVALPDGSVQPVRYRADIAPQVVLIDHAAPADPFEAAFGDVSPFAAMDRMSAAMEAHVRAMMHQAATMQASMPALEDRGMILTNSAGQPVGTIQYSYSSSVTNADGCTQTVRISSTGSEQQPKIIRTSAGDCSSAAAQPVPGIAPSAPAARPITPTHTKPAARPIPKVVPVSAPKPLPEFTPSITI